MPTLYANAKKSVKLQKIENPEDRCLVVMWSDLQVGKVDYRGNSQSLIERVELMKSRLLTLIKKEKPSKVIFADLGDTVENLSNNGRNVEYCFDFLFNGWDREKCYI